MKETTVVNDECVVETEKTDLQQPTEDEARRAKIEAIRQQLAAGSYCISGKDVAGKILEVIKG